MKGFLRSRLALVLWVGGLLTLLGWMASLRVPVERVWADEGTFWAMAESLAEDGDLRFTEADRRRIEGASAGRGHIILQRTASGLAYSKPLLLPLLAAPFYALMGAWGVVVFNVLAFGFCLWMLAAYLRALAKRSGRSRAVADATLAAFVLGAVVVPYVFWRMADSLQLSLVASGLALVMARDRELEVEARVFGWAAAPWIGTALIALTVPMRISNLALALIPALSAFLARRFRQSALRALVVVAVVGGMALLSLVFTGAADPYRAVRTSFSPETDYPSGEVQSVDSGRSELAAQRFDRAPATHRAVLPGSREVGYSALYVMIGRHTGLLFYFPAAVIFGLLALYRRDRSGVACLVGALVTLGFFVVVKSENYFGGETFIGNRYFLSIYPAFLMALSVLPRARGLMTIWMLAVLSYGSAAWSVARFSPYEYGSQSHALAGVFRMLPYESTARGLEGRQDRYWSRHFLRFTDPFARVERWQAKIYADNPPAEVLIASWRPTTKLRFAVATSSADAALVVSDWRGEQRFPLAVDAGVGTVVDIDVEEPWRYHGFWFEQQVYFARLLRFDLDAPKGSRAVLHYLGSPQENESAFNYQLVSQTVPKIGTAKSTDGFSLSLKNTSSAIWEVEDVIAVAARYQLWRGEDLIAESARLPAHDRTNPGEIAEFQAEILWPDEPGVYQLEIDLVQEHVAWFADRLGQPVLRETVEVVAVP